MVQAWKLYLHTPVSPEREVIFIPNDGEGILIKCAPMVAGSDQAALMTR